ncbi:hypothetical protein AC249_AIPGENE25006 [Exaiptasia diaphana]|nr:hypothetical protein AC249_AIPGENE25006 [Exaiptasia diaphana]
MRKLRTGAGDKVSTDANEVALATIYGTKYRIPIQHPIIDNHGVFYAKALNNNLTFQIVLASQSIGVTSDNTKNYSHSLSNIELEYECIHSDHLAKEALTNYDVGKEFYYENVLLHKTFTIAKGTDSLINEHVNLPRRSMTGILMLFIDPYTAGARDSEKFVYSKITKVNVNVDGMPNKLYSKGMVPTDFWDAINNKMGLTDNISQKDFYSDKFALWIADLRTYYDNKMHGSGLVLNSTKDGVRLEINRTASGSATRPDFTVYLDPPVKAKTISILNVRVGIPGSKTPPAAIYVYCDSVDSESVRFVDDDEGAKRTQLLAAFTGGQYLARYLDGDHVDQERIRHDKATEEYEKELGEWRKRRQEYQDWLEENYLNKKKADENLNSTDQVLTLYKRTHPDFQLEKPEFHYTPSARQKKYEIAFNCCWRDGFDCLWG